MIPARLRAYHGAMANGLYWRRDGTSHDDPVEWARLMGDAKARTVAKTDLGAGVGVSTVFLGLDHGFGLTPVPILYETMIFGGPLDQSQWRYPNEIAALAGHDQAVAQVREAQASRR